MRLVLGSNCYIESNGPPEVLTGQVQLPILLALLAEGKAGHTVKSILRTFEEVKIEAPENSVRRTLGDFVDRGIATQTEGTTNFYFPAPFEEIRGDASNLADLVVRPTGKERLSVNEEALSRLIQKANAYIQEVSPKAGGSLPPDEPTFRPNIKKIVLATAGGAVLFGFGALTYLKSRGPAYEPNGGWVTPLKPEAPVPSAATDPYLSAPPVTIPEPSGPPDEKAAAMNYNLGVEAHRAGEVRLALGRYDVAIELNPKLALAYSNRGDCYADLRQYDLALRDLNRAIQLDPKLWAAYNNRSLVYIRLEKFVQAKADIQKVLELEPGAIQPLNNLGLIKAGTKDLEGAHAEFEKGLRTGKFLDTFYFNKAHVEAQIGMQKLGGGDIEGARTSLQASVANYTKCLEHNPNRVDALINRANELYLLGKKKEAFADAESAVRKAPKSADTFFVRGDLYRQEGKFSDAVRDLSKALELDPKRPEILNNRGNTYRELKKYDEARNDFSAAIKLGSVDGYNNRGTLNKDTGRLNEAVADFTKAIELRSDFQEAYINRSSTYLLKEDAAKALSDLAVAERWPGFPGEIHYNYASAYSLLGNTMKALEHLETAVKARPDLRSQVLKDKAFDRLRNEPKYRSLINQG